MKVAATLANTTWLAASLPAWHRFKRGLDRPEESQRQILQELLDDNAASSFGRAHGFGEIRSYEQFCRHVPIMGYEELEPWVRRIMRGEPAVLTGEPVTRLLPTSGSTGGRKLIPFTTGLQRQFNRAIAAWTVDLNHTYPTLRLGPSYWSISPALPDPADQKSAVPIGFDSDSAYLGGVLQQLVEATFAVSSTLRWVNDLECFRYLTLLSWLRQPELSFVSVWHPSFLTLLLDALPAWWDELLTDLARGGCRRAATLAPVVRRAVESSPQPRRARSLRQVGTETLASIWPKWRVVSCWGHGQAALPMADLQTRWPHLSIQPKGLLATEAFVTIPFQSRHPLAVTSHFFEFADDAGAVHPAHALQIGRRYEVIVTTAGGLWRYRLGDIVEVEDFVGATPSLRFLGRGGGVSDLCGEKLTESFVTRIVQTVCQSLGFQPRFAMLAPEIAPPARPCYVLFVHGDAPVALAAHLDFALRQNPHYALCRDLGQLGPTCCHRVPEDAYQIFYRVHLSDGRRLGDIKPQTLSSRTDWRHHFTEDAGACRLVR